MHTTSRAKNRITLWPALAAFAASLILPSYWQSLSGTWIVGYMVFYESEAYAVASALQMWNAAWRGQSTNPVHAVLLCGAMANHLFALALAAALCRWSKTAAVAAVFAVLLAIGCLLPLQLWQINEGWILGPGYFVWCAAPGILAIGALRLLRGRRANRFDETGDNPRQETTPGSPESLPAG